MGNKQSNLKVVYRDEFKASAGKFRAVTMLDSEYYQIGEDQENLKEARSLCQVYGNPIVDGVAVFDDKGFDCFVND